MGNIHFTNVYSSSSSPASGFDILIFSMKPTPTNKAKMIARTTMVPVSNITLPPYIPIVECSEALSDLLFPAGPIKTSLEESKD